MMDSSTNVNGSNTNDLPAPPIENRADGGHHGLGSYDSCESHPNFKDTGIMINDTCFYNDDSIELATQNTEPPDSQAELSSVEGADDWVPFPVERLPEPIRSLVIEGAAAIGCDPVYIALACLVVAAAAIGNTRRLTIKRTWYPCHVIWAAIVGESGTMKTPAFQLVTTPIEKRQRNLMASFEVDQTIHQAKLEQYNVERSAWKEEGCDGDPPKRPEPPTLPRIIVKNATVEKMAHILKENWRGVLLALDELSGWFGSFNRYNKGNTGADESFWLSSFNCQTAVVDRQTGVPPTLFVPDAAVCVFGGIQPGILHRAMTDQNRESGMAARLLMVYPPRKAKQWTDAEVSQKTLENWTELIDRLLELQPDLDSKEDYKPAIVRTDSAARKLFIDFYNSHNREQVDLSGDLAAAWSKLEEYALRFALVLHVIQHGEEDPMDPKSSKVNASTMEDSIAITQWFKAEARRVYRMLSVSAVSSRDRDLIQFIRSRGGRCSARDLMLKNRKQFRRADAADKALQKLVDQGLGTWQTQYPDCNGGRPSNMFVLNQHGSNTQLAESR